MGDANLLLRDSILAILRFLLPYALINEIFLISLGTEEFKMISFTFPFPFEVLYS